MSIQPVSDLGSLLRRYRHAANLTQEDLAERAKISKDTISALERGVSRAPHKDTIELLAEALQLSVEDRAQFEAAARGRLATAQDARRDGSLSLARAEEDQAQQGQPNPTLPLAPASPTSPTDTTSPPKNCLPLTPDWKQVRQQRKRVVLGGVALLVLLVVSSSGLAYWLKLGPFGKGATGDRTPVPAYAYAQPTHTGGTITISDAYIQCANTWCNFPGGGFQLSQVLWGGLYTISPTGAFLPDELMEIPSPDNGDVSPDGLTVTLRLRPDLTWSDGQPVTADDFSYWLDNLLDPGTGMSGLTGSNSLSYGYDMIASYQALDAHTLVLHYKQLFVSYLFYLPHAAPRHAWGSIPPQELIKRDEVMLYPRVTNGPFKIESYKRGQSITTVPNPSYTSTTLHHSVLDKLIFRVYPDEGGAISGDALIASFESGETDFADDESLLLQAFSKIAALPDTRVSRAMNLAHLEFNLSNTLLQDIQVRKAIEEAIDRCAMIQAIFQVQCAALQVDTILPAPSPAYDPTIKTYGYDLAQARKDMQIAGWNCSSSEVCTRGGQPFPPLILATFDAPMYQKAAQIVEQDLAALGIPVTINISPSGLVYFANYHEGGILAQGRYDLALFSLIFSLDPDGDLYSSFHSSQIPSVSLPDGFNFERVNDQNIDIPLEEGRMTLDMSRRTQLYQDIQRVLVQDVYVIPLYLRPNLALVNPNIGNYQANPTDSGNLWNVSDWFLTK